MLSITYLTDKEIEDLLRRIGIKQKSEMDIAITEYKEYWKTVHHAGFRSNNNRGSVVKTMGRRD
jgi:hypothetical protein